MSIRELHKFDQKMLKTKLGDLRGQLFVLKFQIASGKSNKYSNVKKLKIQIAQILTIFKQRQKIVPKIISPE